jgi:hypothetical protein
MAMSVAVRLFFATRLTDDSPALLATASADISLPDDDDSLPQRLASDMQVCARACQARLPVTMPRLLQQCPHVLAGCCSATQGPNLGRALRALWPAL